MFLIKGDKFYVIGGDFGASTVEVIDTTSGNETFIYLFWNYFKSFIFIFLKKQQILLWIGQLDCWIKISLMVGVVLQVNKNKP